MGDRKTPPVIIVRPPITIVRPPVVAPPLPPPPPPALEPHEMEDKRCLVAIADRYSTLDADHLAAQQDWSCIENQAGDIPDANAASFIANLEQGRCLASHPTWAGHLWSCEWKREGDPPSSLEYMDAHNCRDAGAIGLIKADPTNADRITVDPKTCTAQASQP